MCVINGPRPGGTGRAPEALSGTELFSTMPAEREPEPIALSIMDAARMVGVGRTTIYEAMASGRLPARKLGRRTVILDADLRQWLSSLPAMKSRAA
ncbi:MAG TPA: helix-turn-helix domain-containing protein [Microvirga sp.]|jgi:excisionase family DNA binding protein|nr:helix-turn-helix domain-containing protein [Microvirga sp.]